MSMHIAKLREDCCFLSHPFRIRVLVVAHCFMQILSIQSDNSNGEYEADEMQCRKEQVALVHLEEAHFWWIVTLSS